MKTNKLILLLLFFIISGFVSAQNNSTIGLYLNIFKPGQELKSAGWKTSAGFSMEYISKSLWSPKHTPFHFYLGGGFDINSGGSKRLDSVVFNTPNNDKGYVSLSNSVVGVWVGPRISVSIPHSGFQPYIDGHIASRSFGNSLTNTFYNVPAGYQHSNQISVNSTPRIMFGYALGVMYVFRNGVKLDFRYSYAEGAGIKTSDLRTLQYKPGDMDPLKYQSFQTKNCGMHLYRMGIAFPLLNRKERQQRRMQNYQNIPNQSPNTTPPNNNSVPKTKPKEGGGTKNKGIPPTVKPGGGSKPKVGN